MPFTNLDNRHFTAAGKKKCTTTFIGFIDHFKEVSYGIKVVFVYWREDINNMYSDY